MKIVSLTPGTGSFHCGSCIRDNSLVLSLRKLGHDVLMVPLYLPFVTDDQDSSDGTKVFLGGVNAYLQQKSSFFRILPKWIDRIFDNNALLRRVSRNASMTSARDLGEISVSTLKGLEGFQKKEIKHLINFLKHQEKPDVVMISNMLLTGLVETIKDEVGCKVVVCMQGEDTFLDSLPAPWRKECWDLISKNCQNVDLFLPVSRYHGDLMTRRLGLSKEKVTVIHNGLDFSEFKLSDHPQSPPILGFLSRLIPGKGLDILTDAFIHLKQENLVPDLKLKIAGSKTKGEDAFLTSIKEKLKLANVLNDVDFQYNINSQEKIDFLASLTLFSVPAEYGESFGLYVIEAAAAGLPVIQPDSAAFPEILEKLGSGLLYKTGDYQDLAIKINQCCHELEREKARALKAVDKVQQLFTSEVMAKTVAQALSGL
jgi:glycosyltransferase involved in cell wall biosynthesis